MAKLNRGSNDLSTTHPDLAAQWHTTLNGDLTPSDVSAGSNAAVWWQCRTCPKPWAARVKDRAAGRGCPFCAGRLPLPGVNDLATLDPAVAAQWHPQRNGDLTPASVSGKSGRRVWWLCLTCKKEWQATVASRTGGSRCPACAGSVVTPGRTDLETVNPVLAAQWHPNGNGNLTPDQVMPGSNKTVMWLGPCGHEWSAPISQRSAGNGCPVCAGRLVVPGINDLPTVNPDLAAQWHPERNDAIAVTDVSAGSGRKVWWRCPVGHEWQAQVGGRHRGDGCPVCAGRTPAADTPPAPVFEFRGKTLTPAEAVALRDAIDSWLNGQVA